MRNYPIQYIDSIWNHIVKLAASLSTLFHRQGETVLGVATFARSAVFFNIVQKAFDPPRPPPFVLNIILQIFLMDFLKSA